MEKNNQEIKYPFFNRDRILKIEMLENLRDFPRSLLEINIHDLSDGIVKGFFPTVSENTITFSKGIVKYNGQVYLFNPFTLNYSATEDEVAILLTFGETEENKDYSTMPVSAGIHLISEQILGFPNVIELGKFKLKTGAYLRSDYQDLYDFTTEYNTINIVNVKYAGYKEHTLSHLILKYFARAVVNARSENPLDISFSMLCLNSERIERETILSYIAYRLEEELTPVSNNELHEKLVKVLEIIKRESPGLRRRLRA
ncbi:MAG: hypothetical protein FWF50_02355, partial [Defluviitaleaceae bacterium]|nr:hypothetical protein [Defluviitaleaceae bacterium]